MQVLFILPGTILYHFYQKVANLG